MPSSYSCVAAKCSETTLDVDNESAHGPGREETVEAVVRRVNQNRPSEFLTVKANLALSRTSLTAPLALHSTCVINETSRAFQRTCLRRVLACIQPYSTGTTFFEALPPPVRAWLGADSESGQGPSEWALRRLREPRRGIHRGSAHHTEADRAEVAMHVA